MSRRMQPGQEAIYTITGDNLDVVKQQPAARRVSRARRRGAAADRSDRRVLGAGDRRLQGEAVQIGDARRASISTRSRRPKSSRRREAGAAGQARQPDRDLQAGARRRGQGRARLRAADRQRRLSGRRRGRYGHASRAAAQAAPPARHHGQAHPRTQPAPQTDRAPRRDGRRDRRLGPARRNSPGCCSTRRGSSKASSCPTRPPSPAVWPNCSSAACPRRRRSSVLSYSGKGCGAPAGSATSKTLSAFPIAV